MNTETIAIIIMVIMVLGVIFVFISIASHDSKKETKGERMAETAGKMAVEAATGFSNLINDKLYITFLTAGCNSAYKTFGVFRIQIICNKTDSNLITFHNTIIIR